jgi:hypothetical protein
MLTHVVCRSTLIRKYPNVTPLSVGMQQLYCRRVVLLPVAWIHFKIWMRLDRLPVMLVAQMLLYQVGERWKRTAS